MTKRFALFMLPFALALFAACAKTTYKPEIGNANSVVSNGGVVYPIPASDAFIRMKLVTLSEPKAHALHMRLYFKQVKANQQAKLNPSEQILILPDGTTEVKPSRVYANKKNQPFVDLSGRERQLVELVYKLPPGGEAYPHFQFRWKVAYAGSKAESQTVRFHRETKQIQESPAGEQDLRGDFPYYDNLDTWGPDWIDAGFGWWDGFPMI